jgi:hypothetical protein
LQGSKVQGSSVTGIKCSGIKSTGINRSGIKSSGINNKSIVIAPVSLQCWEGILSDDSATLQSTQWIINAAYNQIINAHYNQRLFSLRGLTTKYEANTCLALPHFVYCNHNIHGSGLK